MHAQTHSRQQGVVVVRGFGLCLRAACDEMKQRGNLLDLPQRAVVHLLVVPGVIIFSTTC